MRLIMCALSLSLALVACSKNKDMLEEKNVDGVYFSNEYKGYTSISTDENGTEKEETVVEGDIYNLIIIKDGNIKIHDIDPQDGTYSTQESSFDVLGNIAHAVFKGNSCIEFDPKMQQSIGTKMESKAEIMAAGIKLDDSFMLKISQEDANKILEKMNKEYELLNSRESCEKLPSILDSKTDESTVRSKLKEFLD